MSGYTPLFPSLTTGTLCGKWPDIGLWPIVLSLTDWEGKVDVTPQFLASVTGLPVPEIVACMKRFCAADPGSRSSDASGARLRLLDGHRDWGWLVVNFKLYRRKASDRNQVEDGRNAEKVRRYKERHLQTPQDTTGHHSIPQDTHSYSYSYSDSNSDSNKKKNCTAAAPPTRLVDSRETGPDWMLDFKLSYPERAGDQNWRGALRAANARLAEGHTADEFLAGAKRYAAFIQATGKNATEYVKQAASFLGPSKPFLLPWNPPAKAENASERILRHLNGGSAQVIEHETDELPRAIARG
jgi:hypothetical protein